MLQLENSRMARPIALLVATSLTLPTILAGCGGGAQQTASAPPPPGMPNSRPNAPIAQPRQGMSTKQKVMLLAGAAALYYIYNKRKAKAAQEAGPTGKYFMSESTGRVYYRDLKTGKFQWVSPPAQPIRVPAEEAQQYSGYAGFNNRNDGRGFGGYGPGANANYNDAEPAIWNQ